MPNTASAKKATRSSERNRVFNTRRKTAYKDGLKNYRKTVKGTPAEAAKALSVLFKALDKAAKGKTIKKNTANRLKSRAAQLMTRASKASS